MIRPATLTDAQAITDVYTRSWRETYAGLIPTRVIDAGTIVERRYAEWSARLSDPAPKSILVAESAGAVVGFIWLGPCDGETRERLPGFDEHLSTLYVLAAAHRRGIGRGLVIEAAKAAVGRGSRSLSVDVVETNPARTFYEHLGARFLTCQTQRDGDDVWQQYSYGWSDLTALL